MSRAAPVALDASALIALIFEEPGSAIVESRLAGALISKVNLSEVASYLVRQGTESTKVAELLGGLLLTVIDFDEVQAMLAADLIKKTARRGLSLGDRASLALGRIRALPVLTADRA